MAGSSMFIDAGGVKLHLLRWGSGPVRVVFYHPNSHCGGVWSPLAERLAANGVGVAAVDLRGHGQSDKPDHHYQWSVLRDDALAVLAALDARQVIIIGHSRGGGVTLLAGAAGGEQVAGLFTFEPTVPAAILPQQVSASEVQARVDRQAQRALNRRSHFPSRQAALDHFRSRPAFAGWRQEYLDAFVDHGTLEQEDGTRILACPGRVEARLYEVMYERTAWDGVSRPDLPVTVMFGEHGGRFGEGRDPVAPIRAIFPQLMVQMMPGGSHFGPMEQPEFFEASLRAFAKDIGVQLS